MHTNKTDKYPRPVDEGMVGEYPALAKAGAGFFDDDLLEYRVWCYPRCGAEDRFEDEAYYFPFASFEEALEFSKRESGAQEPIALVRQREWINEIEPGRYVHEQGERIAEWPADCLQGRKMYSDSIANFFRSKNGA